MKPIRVFTPEMAWCGEIDDYESVIYVGRFATVGEFEIKIHRTKKYADTLIRGNIIMFYGDPKKVGVIKYRKITISESGKESEVWTIKGRTLGGVLNKRITLPPAGAALDSITGNAETVLKHYVDKNCVNPVDTNRKIPNLTIATNANRGLSVAWDSRYANLQTEAEQIAALGKIGWDISINLLNGGWIFDVAVGRDLTVDQTALPPVIFAKWMDSINGMEYEENDAAVVTGVYVGGKGEGTARSVVYVGTDVGLSRNEVFMEAQELDTTAKLSERGVQRLAESGLQKSFDATVLSVATPFIYGRDYLLGDIITLQDRELEITMNTRVIQVTEVQQGTGAKLTIMFENKHPTVMDIINAKTKKPII